MASDPFVLHVAALRRHAGARQERRVVAPIDLIEEMRPTTDAESSVPPGADVECDLVLESYPGGVMVSGTVTAPWSGTCGRCTGPVDGRLVVGVRERYVEAVPRPGEPPDEEAYPIVDDELDLRPLVRDALVLELPLAPRCSSSCRGLCPVCGADRNTEDCGCEPPRDPRWANLDVLRARS